ncbi:hypothetical protein SDJN03_21746, partial [Cucurbita argyrosperma subsp. sororia]
MKNLHSSGLCLLVLVAILTGAHVGEAVSCNPTELSPCLSAITSAGARPTVACCRKLKQQQPCFCGYLKDPRFKPYVQSPRARMVASICHIAVPRC